MLLKNKAPFELCEREIRVVGSRRENPEQPMIRRVVVAKRLEPIHGDLNAIDRIAKSSAAQHEFALPIANERDR